MSICPVLHMRSLHTCIHALTPHPADFVMFMLAEEDKSTVSSLTYWFRCCDLDGDGVLNPEELHFFYRIQLQRAVNLGQETIHFCDVLCQLVDLISPKDPRAITLQDLIYPPEKRQLSGLLFDVLFNLQKFLRFETRDPFAEKLKREDGFGCEWDRWVPLHVCMCACVFVAVNDLHVHVHVHVHVAVFAVTNTR